MGPDTSTPEPIAVIGLGLRVAGNVATPSDFWNFLLEGRSNISEVPEERWEPYLRRDPRNAAVLREITRLGTFLDDLAGFDAEFFGVSPREAEVMDPQQRLALEVSWEALEHAGVSPRTLAGSDTAVLMGVNSDDYGKLIMEDLPGIDAWTGIGTSLCGIANRVSHLLDLRGPSVALDAACAASLVAVHQACQMLRAGETSLALAGGVSALIGPGLTRVLDEAGATAPDGRCKTFDAAADGYGRGEGAGVVVLKRLADAERDGDRILAVVRGGATAQDGRTVGIMSPNGAAQADMFRRACAMSGIDPARIGYVEAHGTGTPTGDPTEVGALAEVYGAGRDDDDRCRIGSVKPNIGHLEGGAGVMGLIKTVLALHHEAIPPTAGVRRLTGAVDWATSGLRVPTEVEPWTRGDTARQAAVCSYGYGGTIAHILLEEAPPQPDTTPQAAGQMIVPLSARSPQRLARQAEALADHLRAGHQQVAPVAATLWARRTHEPVRAAIVAQHPHELIAGLDALSRGESAAGLVTGEVPGGQARDAVWVFSGHGSHWAGMGRELLAAEPTFAAVIDEVDEVFGPELGFSAREALSTGELGGTDRIQALTFAMQVGLAAVLRERGVRPAAVIGHSVGEVAACVVSGVFELRQGAAVACYRARGFRSVMGCGAMALVRLPFAEADQRLTGRTDVVAAISASADSCVISGVTEAVEAVCESWSGQGIVVRRVNTDVAFHSPAMDDLTGALAANVAGLQPPHDAVVPLYTTALTDARSTASRDADYWVRNLRGQVRFAEAVTAAAEDGHRLFLEVSAHPVVSHSIVETLLHLGMDDHAVVPLLRRNEPESPAVTTAIASLYTHGAEVEHGVAQADPWADLPVTQWQHRHFWRVPTAAPGGSAVHDTTSHTLLGGRTDVAGTVATRIWQTRLDFDTRPYPGDHPVKGTEIIPAAVLLNTFLTAAGDGAGLKDVRLRTPVAPARARDLQVVLADRELTLASRLADAAGDQDGGWLTHSSAVVDPARAKAATVDLDGARARCTEQLAPRHVIDTLAELGVAAMGFDWDITDLRRGDGELLARVSSEADGSRPTSWASLVDAATSAASTSFDGSPRLRMPARIERVHVHAVPPATAMLSVRRRPGTTTTDVAITDESGSVLLSIDGMVFEELENPGREASATDVRRIVHRVAWHPVVSLDERMPSGVVLVGGDVDRLEAAVDDLTTAAVPYLAVEDPAELESIIEFGSLPRELGDAAVVLVLPRDDDSPEAAVDLVTRTLTLQQRLGVSARLWALTVGVHEGADVTHAPLWGLGRVAAAEHPQLWGGVVDVADGHLPLAALGSLPGHGVLVVRDGVALAARLSASDPASAAAVESAPMQCAPGGTYLITGGTGVLGLRMAQRLADLGARRLVLVSRSGLGDRSGWADDERSAAVRAVTALEERGVSVTVAAVDIGAPGSADALREVLRPLPPVRGVIHAAGVEAGALLMNTASEEFAAAMHPKVRGTLVLHEVFPPEQLDWMVLFSSCGYLAGFPGQGAYGCANAFLDGMARYRRNLGDRTTAVAWTAWRGLGMGSSSEFVAAQLDALGMGTVGADDAMRALELAMREDTANVVVLPVLPAAAAVPILADIAPEEEPDEVGEPAAGEFDPDQLAAHVLTAVASQLGLAESDVNVDLPLVELGVDSIMTVRLRRQLEKQTGLALPPTLLWEHPTAAAVTARIIELLAPAAGCEVPAGG
ncbi:type I polyketide synthase [Mycolicibacterium neworleansense]|uniref:Beta-ketoacyl synthase n=1 Tax=Mycolicibacterium neworleansense TaxID=146018 RepID=A0A0H5RHC7_9MYCO|nr:type I polyketide synthase [Mycolicibacterium neworleansense]MCV7362002.1 type I polyketide synthase [Mycolicibacterium neworleansense]CRZ13590.1 beta-ketoacyl synthase [Mycolicibacterium neworleansense]